MRRNDLAALPRGIVSQFIIVQVAFTLSAWAPAAAAQSNLGELLDAGARKLSPEEFKHDVVERTIMGPTASGGSLEVTYTDRGAIYGSGKSQAYEPLAVAPISGAWRTDDAGRICTTMRIGGGTGGSVHGVALPARCEFWYRQGSQFYFSDSDTDRRARVFRRTLKP